MSMLNLPNFMQIRSTVQQLCSDKQTHKAKSPELQLRSSFSSLTQLITCSTVNYSFFMLDTFLFQYNYKYLKNKDSTYLKLLLNILYHSLAVQAHKCSEHQLRMYRMCPHNLPGDSYQGSYLSCGQLPHFVPCRYINK